IRSLAAAAIDLAACCRWLSALELPVFRALACVVNRLSPKTSQPMTSAAGSTSKIRVRLVFMDRISVSRALYFVNWKGHYTGIGKVDRLRHCGVWSESWRLWLRIADFGFRIAD